MPNLSPKHYHPSSQFFTTFLHNFLTTQQPLLDVVECYENNEWIDPKLNIWVNSTIIVLYIHCRILYKYCKSNVHSLFTVLYRECCFPLIRSCMEDYLLTRFGF